MRRFSRWFQSVMVMSACALGLVHCGVEGNPFYALSASSVANDVPDGATLDDVPDGSDVRQDEAVLTDVSFVDQLDVSDGNVADVVDGAISNSDAVDASDVEDGAVDTVLVFPDLATPDVVTPTPDMVVADDVVDATVAVDVVMTPDIVTVPDTAMTPDVAPAVDVVDASAPIDRPDVPPVMDVVMTPDVVVMSDRPDVVSLPDVVDVPPAVDVVDVVTPPDVPLVPDFVVEYLSVSGGDIIPSGGSVGSLSVAFMEGGVWRWQSYTATRITRDGSSNWFRVIVPQLSSSQRLSPGALLSIVGGCGLNTGNDCPVSWWAHWRVEWAGVVYVGSSRFSVENRITCRDVGGFEQGCVRFSRP